MSKQVRKAKAPFSEVILICAKCAKKLGRGSKTKSALRGELKRALKSRRELGKIRVVDVACLDLCPKGRQVLATGGALAERRLWVLDKEVSAAAALGRIFDQPAAGLPTSSGEAQIAREPSAVAADRLLETPQ